MNKCLFILILAFATVMVYSQTNPEITAKTKLLVYYFHLTNRCKTCLSIESTTKKVLEQYFKTQLNDRVIIFKTFNIDLPENKAISEKYQAYGATFALAPVVSGKEAGTEDLTNFAFSKIHNEEEYITGLKAKIEEFVK